MQTIASHSGLAGTLGKKEVYDPGKNLRLDVLDVAFTSRGAELTVEVFTNGFWSCPDQRVVVRDAVTDAVLASQGFAPTGYYALGILKSGVVPCRETGILVLPNAGSDKQVVFEMYPGDTSPDAAMARTAPYVQSRSFRLGNLAGRATEQRDDPGPVEETVASLAGPFVRWMLLGTAAYVALSNRKAIANAMGNILEG